MKLLFNQVTKLLCVLFLGLLLATSSSFAQLKEVNLRQYTELDGVPGADLSSVLTDKFGYIWMGTINGLARFDGYEFTKFINNPNDPASVQGLFVTSLFEDSKGSIWVGSEPSWLNRYDPSTRTFRQYSFKNLIAHPAEVNLDVICMAEDSKGRIYFGVSGYYGQGISHGLLYLDEKDDSVRRYVPANKQIIRNVYNLTADNKGDIWILSYNGMFKIDSNRQLHSIHSLDSDFKKNKDNPSDMRFDSAGHLWLISTNSRFCEVDLRDSSAMWYAPFKSTDFFRNKLAIDKNDNIWIGTKYGLTRFVQNTKKFEYFQNDSLNQSGKASNPVQDLALDSFGSLWVGTNAQGLLKYEERTVFKSYTSTNDSKNRVTPGWADFICESHDKKIWFVTQNGVGGLNNLDLQTGVIHSIPDLTVFSHGCLQITGLQEDTPDEWILGTNHGIYRYFSKTGVTKKIFLNGLPEYIRINIFLTDSKGNEWLVTYNGIYKKDNSSDQFRRYDLSTLPGSNILSNQTQWPGNRIRTEYEL